MCVVSEYEGIVLFHNSFTIASGNQKDCLFCFVLTCLLALRYKSTWRDLQYNQIIMLMANILLSLIPKFGKADSLSDLVSP